MAQQLIVRILASEFDLSAASVEQIRRQCQVEWGVLETELGSVSSKISGSWFDLEDFIQRQQSGSSFNKIIVLVPVSDVLLTQISLQGRQARYVKQALPFLLEEQLATDIEDNFFALGPKSSVTGKTSVAVVAKEKMGLWLQLLQGCGINADIITTDLLCVPQENNAWSLLLGQEMAWLRTGLYDGLSFDRQFVGDFLAAATRQYAAATDEALTVNLIEGYCQEDSFDAQVLDSELNQISSGQVRIGGVETEPGVLESFSTALLTGQGEKQLINLLQGQYRASNKTINLGFNIKPLILLMTLWLALFLIKDFYQAQLYQQRAEALKQESVALFQSYFPNERGGVKLRQRMENYLRSGGKDVETASFLVLLADAGNVLHQVGQQGKQKISVLRLSYDEKQGQLRMDVKGANFSSLENFKVTLEKQNLNVKMGPATERGGMVEGRIEVSK